MKALGKPAFYDDTTEIYRLGKGAFVGVTYVDKTTVAVISTEGGAVAFGKSKCMEIDKYSKEIGKNLAIARAIENIGKNLAALWASRSVSLDDWNSKHK